MASRTLIILLAACAVTISEAVTEAACDAAVGQCQASALLQKGLKRAKVVASDSEELGATLAKKRGAGVTRTILEVEGFIKTSLNDMYAEGHEVVNGKPIYVSEHDYFIYFCAPWGTWNLGWMPSPFDPASYASGCSAWAYWWVSDSAAQAPAGAADGQWHNSGWESTNGGGVMSTGLTCSSYYAEADCDGAPEGCHWVAGRCTAEWQVFAPGGPQFNDVDQGSLGTCYFLAALASVAYQQPSVIQNMYVSGQFDTYPVHVVKFLLTGRPTLVAVDEMFPVNDEEKPVFVKYDSESLTLWPMLYEKAWAKVFGSFKAIEGGTGYEAFKAIAQVPVDRILHDDSLGEDIAGSVWAAVVDAEASKCPMYASTSEHAPDVGLATGHAYALLGTGSTEINGVSRKTVRLYNPWGVTYYEGQVQNDEAHLDDGHFYMLLDEYVTAFRRTEIARVKEGYEMSFVVVMKDSDQIATLVDFAISDDEPFVVQLEWPSSRLSAEGGCDMPQPRANIEIFRDGVSVVNASMTNYRSSQWFSNVRADVPGGAGHYTVHVRVHFPDSHWVDEVVLNTYAASATTIHGPVSLPPQPAGFVELGGFAWSDLNGKYEEQADTLVNGLETYWNDAGLFLYYCATYNDWRVVYDGYLSSAQAGNCGAYVQCSGGVDVLQVDLPKGWWEWSGSEWVHLHEGGVVSNTHNHPMAEPPTTTLALPTVTPHTTTLAPTPAPTPAPVPAPTPAPTTLFAAVSLHGFTDAALNGNYTERLEDEWKVNGAATYWQDQGGFYIYYCAFSSNWRVTDTAIGIQQGGKCLSRAKGPANVDISSASSGWVEKVGRTWGDAGNAGVSWAGSTTGSLLQAQSKLGYGSSSRSTREACTDVLQRLDELENTNTIVSSMADPIFPAELSSIANSGETCGDTAQGISESCEIYNNWKALSDIMADARR